MYRAEFKTITLKISEKKTKYIAANQERSFNIARSIYKELSDDQEHFTVLFIDTQLKVIGFKTIFSGSMNTSIVDLKVLFRNIILFGAINIILIHNHPSGILTPSEDDKIITTNIIKAGKLFNIKVLDHLIISKNKYISFEQKGLILKCDL